MPWRVERLPSLADEMDAHLPIRDRGRGPVNPKPAPAAAPPELRIVRRRESSFVRAEVRKP